MSSEPSRDYQPLKRRSKDFPLDFTLEEDGMMDYLSLSNQPDSQPSDRSTHWDFSKKISESVKLDDGPPARYQLRAERVNLDGQSDEDSKLRRFTVGERDPKQPKRSVLLVGATGSGKSTLINALVNFVMGVKFEDKIWFEIIVDKDRPQLDSQTSTVSVYEVFGFEGKTLPFSLTIIDTPGFGDTRELDDLISNALTDLFSIPGVVDKINAVGLVLKATENRLNDRMAYVFNSVTSLFGKDMEQNIVALMTHSHGGMKPKNALQALEDAKIKCARNENNEPIYFLFNNCQKDKIENSMHEEAAMREFKISEDGMKHFTAFVGDCNPQFLIITVEVLGERTRLTACIQNLKERLETIERQQKAIKNNQEQVSKHEEEMKKNQNYSIEVEEIYQTEQKINNWFDKKAVRCTKCKENCHYPGCILALSPKWCDVMKDGKCTSCAGKCPEEDHVKDRLKYVTETRKVTKTLEEMKDIYEENKAKREEKSSLLDQMEKEVSDLEQTKNQCLNEAFQIIERLERIALNVDSVFTIIHLDFLIEKMSEREDNQRVLTLEGMRARVAERDKAAAEYLRRNMEYAKNK